MIKIAICDDEEKELQRTKSLCSSYVSKYPELDIRISSYQSSTELLSLIERENFDVLLLDIYMPEMTGIQLAQSLRKQEKECQIVFVTTSLAHAIEAFSLHAAHYLVKPYTEQQLGDALNKAITAIEKKKNSFIMLKTANGILKVNLAEIIYTETERHIQNIHLADGKNLAIRITCLELFELVSGDSRFYKCGSTYIINLGKIEEVTSRTIIFENNEQIPMMRRQYKELLEQYTRYSLEGN